MELNIRNILNVLHGAEFSDAHWDDLGLYLMVKRPSLLNIETDRRGNPAHCMIDMLSHWLNNDEDASWDKLAGAVGVMTQYGRLTADKIM